MRVENTFALQIKSFLLAQRLFRSLIAKKEGAAMAHKANSLAHTKWLCKYHIVFTPKYRRKIIYNKYREDLREILKMLCDWKGVEILEGHLMPDHIHMLVSILPKISVSSFMGYLKGKSSLLMFDYMQTLNTSMVIENFGLKATMYQPQVLMRRQ